ncbi:MAG: response regulator [Chloroflexi bacterium]|nr:response regulator [Chloroflexota bacterium]
MDGPKHIVVIDDDPDFLAYVKIILTSHGYVVATATSADEGLQRMRERAPDLVMLDMMMSYALDGWTVSRAMQFDPDLREVPVLMVSAIVSDDEDSLFAHPEQVRIDAFMTKPVSPEDLVSQVGAMLRPAQRAAHPEE